MSHSPRLHALKLLLGRIGQLEPPWLWPLELVIAEKTNKQTGYPKVVTQLWFGTGKFLVILLNPEDYLFSVLWIVGKWRQIPLSSRWWRVACVGPSWMAGWRCGGAGGVAMAPADPFVRANLKVSFSSLAKTHWHTLSNLATASKSDVSFKFRRRKREGESQLQMESQSWNWTTLSLFHLRVFVACAAQRRLYWVQTV